MNESVEVFERKLTHADDRIGLSEWIPQQWGVFPAFDFASIGSTFCGCFRWVS
jgi:hypothetical protein